ncbi:MAG: translocation/assembly module TamB domain-containing protein [Ferruginibacter sp.]
MTSKIILIRIGKSVLYKPFVAVFLINFFLIVGSRGESIPGNKTLPLTNIYVSQFSPVNQSNANDTIPLIIIKRDQANIIRYSITGMFIVSADSITFSLSDSIVLNYKTWITSPGNRISYSSRGILFSNLSLSSDSANISAISRQDNAGGPIDISIQNFNISDLTGIIHKDSLAASGLLDAKFLINGFGKLLHGLSGTASVRNFALMQQPVGNLQLDAKMTNENTLHANLGLAGNGNDVNVGADIFLNNGLRQLAALIDIKNLQLTTLQGFLKNKVNFTAGSVNGQLALKGKLAQPEWTGALNFDTTRFGLNQFGTTYTVDKQKVVFDYPAINFSRFLIKDSLDHVLTVNGNLCAKSLKAYDLELDLKAQDFKLISAPKAINNQIYGNAIMDAQVAVTGSTSNPSINGDINLKQGSDVALVLPEKNTNRDAARSVVRFINRKNAAAFPGRIAVAPVDAVRTDSSGSLAYKLTIKADNQATLTIIIDPTTGDLLKVKGIAELSAGLGSTGKTAMLGVYRLDSGYYELNYQFLRKRFNLIPGSTIDFNGPATNAQINIRAEYLANTAVKDLLGNEVGSVDPKIARSFNQKIPFRVILSLTGVLNKPAISFDIQLADDQSISRQLRTTIENKLVQLRTDVASTNKQVFALLALDRFVGEQSIDFFKGNGTDFSDVGGESVSKFLSAALDQIASDLFKGINIDLNLNSYKDFTNNDDAQKTDLNIDVSKNFLNDRLTVAVGRNFGIESQDASTKASQQKASRFLPDVTVNYKLSTDGKYMIRSYKKTPFEVVLDGYVIETGLAFIMTMDYDMFNELFYRRNKKTAE